MGLIATILLDLIDIAIWIIIASAIVSWLIAFDVLDTKNPQTANLVNLLNRVTDPIYKPLRRYVPPVGGIDVTPIIVIILLVLLKQIIYSLLVPVYAGTPVVMTR